MPEDLNAEIAGALAETEVTAEIVAQQMRSRRDASGVGR
jgi:hypothetical protein